VAMLSHAFNRLSSGKPLIAITPPLIPVMALAVWAVATVPFSYWPGGSVEYLTDLYFKTLVVFFLLTQVIVSLSRLRAICWSLALMSIPLALTTVKNYLAGVSYDGSDRVVGYSAALTSNPNDMALMLNLILPVCVGLFLAERRSGMKLLLGSLFMLLVLGIVLTFSRAGFLTMGVSGLSYMWLLRKRAERVWIPVLLVLALAALPLVPDSYVERISTIVSIEEDASGSAQTRVRDSKVALEVALANPLIGSGIGVNALAMNDARGSTWTEIHNVYLQYAVELGLPGLLLFLAFYFRCLGVTRRVLRRTRGQERHRTLFCLAEGIQVSLIAFAVAAFFHPVAYHFYFYYMAGLAIAVGAVFRQHETPSAQSARAATGVRS
jgi:putative inorganic carbon (hco3(-)) transporter